VSGYGLVFENPVTGKHESLFRDAGMGDTMFRVVVKSNLTMTLAVDLVRHIFNCAQAWVSIRQDG
jgi:hypothetical protein